MPLQRFEALHEHPAEERIRVVPSHLGPGDFQVPRHFGDGEAGGISLQEIREPPKRSTILRFTSLKNSLVPRIVSNFSGQSASRGKGLEGFLRVHQESFRG
jgi:hypothetical protein